MKNPNYSQSIPLTALIIFKESFLGLFVLCLCTAVPYNVFFSVFFGSEGMTVNTRLLSLGNHESAVSDGLILFFNWVSSTYGSRIIFTALLIPLCAFVIGVLTERRLEDKSVSFKYIRKLLPGFFGALAVLSAIAGLFFALLLFLVYSGMPSVFMFVLLAVFIFISVGLMFFPFDIASSFSNIDSLLNSFINVLPSWLITAGFVFVVLILSAVAKYAIIMLLSVTGFTDNAIFEAVFYSFADFICFYFYILAALWYYTALQ